MDLAGLGDPDLKIGQLRIWFHGRESEDATDYWDANWMRTTANCADNGASVTVHGAVVHLSELQGFLAACEKLDETLQGQAELACMEPHLNLVMAFSDKLGHIGVKVRITPDHLNQEHVFRFSIDQSYLTGIVRSARMVLEHYPVRGRQAD